MKADLTDLIERLEKATGPARELDRAIALACGVLHYDDRMQALYRPDTDGSRTYGGLGDDVLIRPYTASIDAALALVARVRPDGWPGLQKNRHGERPPDWSAWIDLLAPGEHECVEATAATPAIALCLALLRSMETKQTAQTSKGGGS